MQQQIKKTQRQNLSDVNAHPARSSGVTMPNSAMDKGMANDMLGELMAERMRGFMDNQIPAAEAEADSIAHSVSDARTPEEVKSRLGQTMGADFSNVRFHTGADSASTAQSMGARAYATGSDIYFGDGGFDPQIAAHELVHTVQQGVVDSAMSTVAAPAGGIQMTPEEEARKDKYNQKLAKLGPKAIERILSGKGGRFEKKKFKKIMGVLNGSNKNELSEQNIAMLYGGGEASKNFIVNRTLDNMVSHVQNEHEKANPNGYNKTGKEHEKYMSTLQNSSVRAGGGGALKEYGILSKLLSDKALTNAIGGLNTQLPANLEGVHTSEDSFKNAARENGERFVGGLPGALGAEADPLREYNGAFMQKLKTSMPTAFNDEETNRSFVGKSSALRGFFPSAVDMNRQLGAFGTRSMQFGLSYVNEMMSQNEGLGKMTPQIKAFRDAILPQAAPPTVAPPTTQQSTGQNGTGGTMGTFAYRDRSLLPRNDGSFDPSQATDDELLAVLYNKIKNPDPNDDPETVAMRKREFARLRASQMESQRNSSQQNTQATPAPKKRKKFLGIF